MDNCILELKATTMRKVNSKSAIEVVRFDQAIKDPSATNSLKFGISSPLRDGGKGELVFLGPDQPLSDAIAQVCQTWGFPDPTIFALKFNEPPGHYVTEETKQELSGKLAIMCHSPLKVCQEIRDKFKYPSTVELGLKELSEKASDPTFADVFVTTGGGLSDLKDLMEKEKLGEKAFAYLLQTWLHITLESNHTSWESLPSSLISRIAGYINNPKGSQQDRLALRAGLQVLENAVISGIAYAQVIRETPLANLIMLLIHNNDAGVQQNVLSLINALLIKADPVKRKYMTSSLSSRTFKDKIFENVVKRPNEARPAETNYQLYVLQSLVLNALDERRTTPVDPQDDVAMNRINDLRRIAFDSDGGAFNFGSTLDLNGGGGKKEKPNCSRDYRRLGFLNDMEPTQDFRVTPPGILALDCMYYLATYHVEIYNKIVLETARRGADDECPFARSSIALTSMLCDILCIGEPPKEQDGKFYTFFFQHENPFEELFCICATLVIKTWKEMRATVEDFGKVMDVVKEQIDWVLATSPESLDGFQRGLKAVNYNEITNLRYQKLSSKEAGELQAKPIQELKKKLEPEMLELIKLNRRNYLIAGTRFSKYSARVAVLARVKEKFWFCRLSPNGKILHYGDCDENATPTAEELTNKVNIVDLLDLVTGKDCPNMKDRKKTNASFALAFSLVKERDPPQSIDFIAPDEKTFDMWTDGMNALLGKPMVSKEAKADLDILLNMELKLRLLDIDGIPEIPQEPPTIPELPTNFDFSPFMNIK